MADHYHATPNSAGRYPPERKTTHGAVAAYVAMFLLAAMVRGIGDDPNALAGMPAWLSPIVVALVPAVASFTAGWLTKHQLRGTLTTTTADGPVTSPRKDDTGNDRLARPRGAHKRDP